MPLLQYYQTVEKNKKWWRRGESNPRPRSRIVRLYMLRSLVCLRSGTPKGRLSAPEIHRVLPCQPDQAVSG